MLLSTDRLVACSTISIARLMSSGWAKLKLKGCEQVNRIYQIYNSMLEGIELTL